MREGRRLRRHIHIDVQFDVGGQEAVRCVQAALDFVGRESAQVGNRRRFVAGRTGEEVILRGGQGAQVKEQAL